MSERIDFTASLHNGTKRDYVARVVEADKAACSAVAGEFGADYWDGERRYGYGGYRYDGRWAPVAAAIAERYDLRAGARVLDVGCGKGFLLYELTRTVPGLDVTGVDISRYAIEHAKAEMRAQLHVGSATALPFADASFDLVISLGTLHNLGAADLWRALREIERVKKQHAYVMVESYRNEREKVNLLYWQLTCRSFHSTDDWQFIYSMVGYTGDYGYIFFE